MELVARVSVRRHILGDGLPQEPAPPLTVFRLLGRSPNSALRLLRRALGDDDRAPIALSIDSPALSSNQLMVYEAVLGACRRESRKVIVCGGSREMCLASALPGKGTERWYPSLKHLLCESVPDANGSAMPRPRKAQEGDVPAPGSQVCGPR